MKIKDVAKENGFIADAFENYLRSEGSINVSGAFTSSIPDADVPRAVELYKKYLDDKAMAEQRAKAAEAEKERKIREKKEAVASMLITSGFNFDGYTITKYSGYISGDDATQIPRSGIFGGNNGQNLTDALVKIRIQAIKELKEAAYDLGCNAVIGVDFDYLTLEPETANIAGGTRYEPYVICVTANGNAVVIEKNK